MRQAGLTPRRDLDPRFISSPGGGNRPNDVRPRLQDISRIVDPAAVHVPADGAPASEMVPCTRKVNVYGFSSLLPSIAAKSLLTVTLYAVAGFSGAAGVNRSVIGSRHSTRPGTAGVMLQIRLASTVASREPATGRSNVTETMLVEGAASRSVGVTRRTRSGVGPDTAKLVIASVTTAESARIKPLRWGS